MEETGEKLEKKVEELKESVDGFIRAQVQHGYGGEEMHSYINRLEAVRKTGLLRILPSYDPLILQLNVLGSQCPISVALEYRLMI